MKKLEQVKEITMIDQFIAITDLLENLGYKTSELTIMDIANIRYDILKSIESLELKEQFC
jgi:hypothetical protein